MRRLILPCLCLALIQPALIQPTLAQTGPQDCGARCPSNAEMTALFAADQKARDSLATDADWDGMSAQDAQRRERTAALLASGALASGNDYYHAAHVFQHGDLPRDYLKAHALATIAIAKGRRDATWIAAATLDRYLQSIGQPQIYGTQYKVRDGKASQAPYDRALLSDPIRTASDVKTLPEQERQRQDYEKQAAGR